MDRQTFFSPSPPTNDPAPSAGPAREMVAALDQIFDFLMAAAPVESTGIEIPLTPLEVRAVRKLAAAKATRMHELANSLRVPLPTATHVVNRLVEKGVVVRFRPEYDRRVVLVELSEKSRARQQTLYKNRVEMFQRVLAPLAPPVQEQMAQVFTKIAQAASAEESTLPGAP